MSDAVTCIAPASIVRWRDAVLHMRVHCRVRDGERSRDVAHNAKVIAAIDDGTNTPRFVIRPVRSR